MLRRLTRFVVFAITIALLGAASLQAQGRTDSLRAVRAFVDDFYAWYVPLADTGHVAGVVALQQRRHQISDGLYAAIKAADDMQASTHEEVFGADYFLLSQDPCHHYHVTSVTRVGTRFRARVECVESNEYHHGVFAEVAAVGRSWRLTNVIPADRRYDLVSWLIAEVAARRSKPNEG